ncbi:hypothetical protein ACTID9_01085 [Brevibacillus fluminis]|uniref:hypothetical protein n=1 Tax=Brevibacillus fluminis TaxID=511487 RepID=UPI003F8996AA
MDPIIQIPTGYSLDAAGNLKKWKTDKQKLKQRLMNRLVIQRGATSIPGYEETGSQLYTLNRYKRSELAARAREFVEEALQPEVDIGQITKVAEVTLSLTDDGIYQLAVAVELSDGEILDLEVGNVGGN